MNCRNVAALALSLLLISGGLATAAFGQVISSGQTWWTECDHPARCPDGTNLCEYQVCYWCTDPEWEGECEGWSWDDCYWAVWGGNGGCGTRWFGVCPGAGWQCQHCPQSAGGTCNRFACWNN